MGFGGHDDSFRLVAGWDVRIGRTDPADWSGQAAFSFTRFLKHLAALRQQTRYLRTLIDMLPMWAWFKDTGDRYLVTNKAHARACRTISI